MKLAVMMLGGKRGGVEQAAVDHCLALRHAGHAVTAIVRAGAAILPALEQAQIPAIALRMPHRWNPWTRVTLQQHLPTFDAICLHGNRPGALTRGLRHLPPVIAVAHSRFFKPQPHFARVVALTDLRAQELREQLDCPVSVIPNLVAYPQTVTRAALRTPPVIGFMGRLSHEKGGDLFLEALAQLRARGIAARALLGGDGNERANLEQLAQQLGIADMIDWRGWVNDKPAFFSAVDVFCLSSRTESFPLTLLEAMAHGCPIVATNCGGPASMLTAETGILTPITPEGIADGIARILASPDREAMGLAARARVAQHYTLPVVAAQWDALLAARGTY